jgi:exopolysaccharide biosynthesis polyprenyl glycosylphosphotransferase
MAVKLALLEGCSLFVLVCSAIFVWGRPLLGGWIDLVTVIAQGGVLSLCCIVTFYYSDLYDLRISRNFGEFASRLVKALGITFFLLALLYAVFPRTKIVDGSFVTSLLMIGGFVLPLRAMFYALMRSRPFCERVLVLGTSALGQRVVTELQRHEHLGYSLVCVAADEVSATPTSYPVLGPLARLDKIIEEVRPDRIVVALTERRGRLPLRQLLDARVRGILVEDGVEMYERLTGKLAIESLTPSNLIFSGALRKSALELAVGRGLSLLLAVTGGIVLAPLLAAIAVAIKLDSPGPVLFVQPRVGLGGRPFRLLKFRSMRPMASRTSEWVRDNGDRITRVGKWLRKTRFDELPQFWNIIRGDMNLVGPRPHPVTNHEMFAENIPYYSLRVVVRPGITGWAQIRYGYANNLEEETEKMRYDLFYIKHLSMWMDLRILFDTVKIVLFGRGAVVADAYPGMVPIEAGRH